MTEFPPIYVINVERSTKRLELFRRRNPHLVGATRHPAVDGASIDREELLRSGVILEDCPYAPGTLGGALSHVSLWQQACAEQRSITIFEDDTVAVDTFQETAAGLLATVPSAWEIVIWGYPIHERLGIWVDYGVGHARINWYWQDENRDLVNFQREIQNYSLAKLLNCWGGQAYSVSPSGARRLLDVCLPLRKRIIQFSQPGVKYWDEAIDGPMNAAYPSMKAFVCIPPLVMHDEGLGSDRKVIDNE